MTRKAVEQVFTSLAAHARRLEGASMARMFDKDLSRFDSFSVRCGDLLLDYSKNRIDAAVMDSLLDLARAAQVGERRDAMAAGTPVNVTENRAVMHMALRYRGDAPRLVNGRDVMSEVRGVLRKIEHFSSAVHSGEIAGITGRTFTDIVNIGIGGSDLGPAMVTGALAPYVREGVGVHFISNVDGAQISDTLKGLDPASTLFVVASKSFTTDETMTNARTARHWLVSALGEDAVRAHFAAVSTNIAACRDFGLDRNRIFGFWDWVGGRYSVWSAIGLPVVLAIGFSAFEQFLQGAAEMDEHFLHTPLERNMPVLLALIGIWHRNVCNFPTQAILPYDQRLHRFPAYLQQLDMESNGKSVQLDGTPVSRATGPVVWGEPGTNGQHAFFQLLHQGTDVVPCDFLVAANPHDDLPEHHDKLLANCLAQSQALMCGKDLGQVLGELRASGLDERKARELAPHKVFPGNRPSNTLLYPRLDPAALGKLIALYEHKIFVQGVIWNINSFDQWGVELGKELARDLLPQVQAGEPGKGGDGSTRGLLEALAAMRS